MSTPGAKKVAVKKGLVKKVAAKKASPAAPSARVAKKAPRASAAAVKRASAASPAGPRTAGGAFAGVFAALRAILAKQAPGLVVKADTSSSYYVVSPKPYRGKELFFGAVRVGKAYVSYHFFPLYMNPRLGSPMTPALAGRMQGKSCFNFKAVDAALFAQIDALTAKGRRDFEAKGLL